MKWEWSVLQRIFNSIMFIIQQRLNQHIIKTLEMLCCPDGRLSILKIDSAAQKFLEPYEIRVATRATIQIHGEEILAYSIHTEPVFTLPKFKEDQYTAVLKDVCSDIKRAVVGGDFNSFTEPSIERMEDRYQEAGFERASQGSGYTFVRWGCKMAPDHIFAKGFAVKDQGKIAEATASDHLPLWVRLTLK